MRLHSTDIKRPSKRPFKPRIKRPFKPRIKRPIKPPIKRSIDATQSMRSARLMRSDAMHASRSGGLMTRAAAGENGGTDAYVVGRPALLARLTAMPAAEFGGLNPRGHP